MRIPVTRNFDPLQPIGYLTLRDDVDIPLNSVFSLAYRVEEWTSDGKPAKGRVQSVSLIPDSSFLQYLKHEQEYMASETPTNGAEEQG